MKGSFELPPAVPRHPKSHLCVVCVTRALSAEHVTAEGLGELPAGVIETAAGPSNVLARFLQDMATGENMVMTMTTDADEELWFTAVTSVRGMPVCADHTLEVVAGGPFTHEHALAHRRINRMRSCYMSASERVDWNDLAVWRLLAKLSAEEAYMFHRLPNEDIHHHFMECVKRVGNG